MFEATVCGSIVDDILLYDERIVIPRPMRLDILDCIHQGITKYRARARTSVWWPGLSTMIEQMVSKCVTCAKDRPVPTEPLMASSFPSRPWERLAMDLFELHGKVYLIVIDYYSRWIESKRLDNLSSESVVYVLKEVFASHDISPVCNEPWVCACDEFSAISSIERRSRTSCAYYEGASEEERRSTHRSHGIQIDAASEWAISSRNVHGPKIAYSTNHPPNRSETEGFPRRVPGKEGRSTSFKPAAKLQLTTQSTRLTKATTWRSSLDQRPKPSRSSMLSNI